MILLIFGCYNVWDSLCEKGLFDALYNIVDIVKDAIF